MTTTKGMTYGHITDEEIARVEARTGNLIHPYQYNTQATRDAIRHFADGIGDDNPLFRDETYARSTRYGTLVAPPCFLYSVRWPGAPWGFPGVHGFQSGNSWDFYKTVHVDDILKIDVIPSGLEIKTKSDFAARTAIVYGTVIYRNQRDEIVAKGVGWTVRAERDSSKAKGKYKEITKYKYTPEELKKIEASYDGEVVTGSRARLWEDVKVGDALAPVVKGPLNLNDMHAFIAGTLGGESSGRGGAHKFGLLYRRRHPAWAYTNPETGTVDIPEMVHIDGAMSEEIGIPIAYDYGCQRGCWMGHLLTNWVGDDGFVKKMYFELRRFNMLGDTTWMKGKVIKKFVENGEYLVDVQCWGENQRGETTTPGFARVQLPSRTMGHNPIDIPEEWKKKK